MTLVNHILTCIRLVRALQSKPMCLSSPESVFFELDVHKVLHLDLVCVSQDGRHFLLKAHLEAHFVASEKVGPDLAHQLLLLTLAQLFLLFAQAEAAVVFVADHEGAHLSRQRSAVSDQQKLHVAQHVVHNY